MGRLKGIEITLINKVEVGKDPLGKPIYEDKEVEVKDVLIAPYRAEDLISKENLTGRKAIYTLAIPKGDVNVWEEQEVRFFNETWRVIGIPLQGIDSLIPLRWNKKVVVERYE